MQVYQCGGYIGNSYTTSDIAIGEMIFWNFEPLFIKFQRKQGTIYPKCTS